MEAEKQLYYRLAVLNSNINDANFMIKQVKIEKDIAKCRDIISGMKVKLTEVLERVKNSLVASADSRTEANPSHSKSSHTLEEPERNIGK